MRSELFKILFSLSKASQKRTFVALEGSNLVINWNLWREQWHFRRVSRVPEGSYLRRVIDEFPALRQSDLLLQVLLNASNLAIEAPILAQRLDAFKQILFAEPLTDDSEKRLHGHALSEDVSLRYKAFRRNFDPWCEHETKLVLSCVNSALHSVLADAQPPLETFTTVVSLGLLKDQLEKKPPTDGYPLEDPIVLPTPLHFTVSQERKAMVDGFRHGIGMSEKLNHEGIAVKDHNYNIAILRNILAHIWEAREHIEGLPLVRLIGQGALSLEEEIARLPLMKTWFETYTQVSARMLDPVSEAMPAVANELPHVVVYYRYHIPSAKKSLQRGRPTKRIYSVPFYSDGRAVNVVFSRMVVYLEAMTLGFSGIEVSNYLSKQKIKPIRAIKMLNDRIFISLDFALAITPPSTQDTLLKWFSSSPDVIRQRIIEHRSSRKPRVSQSNPFTQQQDLLLWDMASRVLTNEERRSIPNLFIEHRAYRTNARYRLIKETYNHNGTLALLSNIPALAECVNAKVLKANYQAFTTEERKEHMLLFFNPKEKEE